MAIIIKAHLIRDLRSMAVKHIWENGEEVVDERGEITLECRNMELIHVGQSRLSAECGLTSVLDQDFAKGLIDDEMARKKGEQFDYAYGWQMRKYDILPKIIKKLRENPNTRRAYIPLFHPDNVGSTEEVPCCTAIDILIRDGVLFMTTFFRSNEMYQAAMTDIYGFCAFQEHLAKRLGYHPGEYHQYICSAHLRMSDEDGIKKLLELTT